MKKIILLAVSLAAFSSSSFGYDELLVNSNYKENNWWKVYLRANVGASLLNGIKDSTTAARMKSKPVAFLSFGVGTYFMDNTRVDITFEHPSNSNLKKAYNAPLSNLSKTGVGKIVINNAIAQANSVLQNKLNFMTNDRTDRILKGALSALNTNSSAQNFGELISQAATVFANQFGFTQADAQGFTRNIVRRLNVLQNDPSTADLYYLLTQDFSNLIISNSVSRKPTINAFMVNGAIDIYEFNKIKFFVGAGVGMAQLKEKIIVTSSIKLGDRNITIIDGSTSTKKANNFAYALTAGASAKVSDKATVELAYSWKDFGKTKSAKFQGVEVGKTPFRSHTLTAGIRFDI